jgi:hypothetical protein
MRGQLAGMRISTRPLNFFSESVVFIYKAARETRLFDRD